MGSLLSVPSVPVDEIGQVAQGVLEVFVPLYIKAYPGLLAKSTKQEAEQARAKAECTLKLKDPPPSQQPLLEGTFDKRGDVRKSWKTRNFVALNKADNFKILYFKSQADTADHLKKLGEMTLDGYDVEQVTDAAEKAQLGCGDFGLKMSCGRRRLWVVSFRNAQERNQWQHIFEFATRKAAAPLNDDPVLAEAFTEAFDELRRHYGYLTFWRPAGTECEMLGELIAQECNREVMRPVYEKIRELPEMMRGKVEKKVEDVVHKTVSASVSAVWKTTQQTIALTKQKAEEIIKENLTKLFEAQLDCKSKIKEAITQPLPPLVERIVDPVLKPATEQLLGPIFAAFAENVRLFDSFASELGDTASGEQASTVKDRLQAAEYYSGFMYEAYEKLHAFTRAETMQKLSGAGFNARTIEDRIEDELKQLQRRALVTLQEELKGNSKPVAELKTSLMEKLRHDSKVLAKEAFVQILVDVLTPPFEEHVQPAVAELISPIASLIPDVLKDPPLLDIETLLSETLEEILTGICEAVAEPICQRHASKLGDV